MIGVLHPIRRMLSRPTSRLSSKTKKLGPRWYRRGAVSSCGRERTHLRDHIRPNNAAQINSLANTEAPPSPSHHPAPTPSKEKPRLHPGLRPLLGECKGLDEATFHAFLHDFHQATQASPYPRAINIAALIGSAAPSLIAFAVSTSISLAALGAIEVQNRVKSNA